MNVSLTSIMSSYGYGTTSSTSQTDASAAVQAALEKLAKDAETKAAASSSSGTQVNISQAALAAAAAKADNAKDASVVLTETRATLDAQYAAGTAKGSADLSQLSGRALALMALNKDGSFSAAESRAAKQALKEDTQTSFLSAMSKGLDASSIASFSTQLAAQYDDMSPEEREARGWSEQFRNSSADFSSKINDMPSLFDQI
ncbi:hypothetical protein KRR38_24505 [Novosphingobium sp. G106]|uniref:hypothetical protein n=1 Tax=Novosphingobium sp. G106 TaxID=2849500 RepID=UPI001C2D3E4B|nr:hypothetical protein [Novosphingobium sp. G106]MBV1690752.1 hypothetical protein [Novosphingobium sp. G106]